MKIKLLLATFLCFLPWSSPSAQTIDEIIKKAIEARGGIDKNKAVESERITGRVAFSEGLEGTVVPELERPHKLSCDITQERQTALRTTAGTSAASSAQPIPRTEVMRM